MRNGGGPARAVQPGPTQHAAGASGEGKANPRFVVTSLPIAAVEARALYEDLYGAHGLARALATGCPHAAVFARVHATLAALPMRC